MRKSNRFKDLTGLRFGMLIAEEAVDKSSHKWRWRCQCDCGKKTLATGTHLSYGVKRSCGCLHSHDIQPGQVYGDFKVHHRDPTNTEIIIVECTKCQYITNKTSSVLVKNPRHLTICGKFPYYASFKRVYNAYKNRCKLLKRDFNLTEEDFLTLAQSNCAYCGVGPSQVRKEHKTAVPFCYNSLDRVDSELGYSKANCVACCDMCNCAKLNYPLDIFQSWIKRLVDFNKQEEQK